MGKYDSFNYHGLSRKGLIKLCEMYDKDNNYKLNRYAKDISYCLEKEKVSEKFIDALDTSNKVISYVTKGGSAVGGIKDVVKLCANMVLN